MTPAIKKGIWRSYRVFHFSGRIEQHDSGNYREIMIDAKGSLVLLHSLDKRNTQIYESGQWRIGNIRNRRYLYLGRKQAYEIITFEAGDLVLQDLMLGEKQFYISREQWPARIQAEARSALPAHKPS